MSKLNPFRYSISQLAIPFFIITASLNFRLRLPGQEIHIGGAELALSPYDFALALLLALAIASTKQYSLKLKHDPLIISFIAFITLSFLSIINSQKPEFTFYELLRCFKFFILLILLRRIFQNPLQANYLIKFSALFIILETLYSLYQLSTGSAEATEDATQVRELFIENGITRVTGTLRHPALLSLCITLLIPFTVIGAVYYKNKKIYLFAIVLAFGCITLTYSRTQIVLYFLTLAMCLFWFKTPTGKKIILNKKIIYGAALVFSAVMLYGISEFESIKDRFVNAPESSTTTRLLLANIAIKMLGEHYILGVGWNNFIYAMPFYDDFGVYRYFQHPVHNMVLLIASETGIIGLLAYFSILLSTYGLYKKTIRLRPNQLDQNIIRAAAISLIVLHITGLQGWSFRADSIQLITIMCISLIAGIHDKTRRHHRESHLAVRSYLDGDTAASNSSR
ncbi:O-antigen ligase family protein [Pseudomonas taiwanensis]|uniref:O-antigen ligase family protein n=1 Tax=Pseudomonas taiwanensis TaxID=470150 RepID=UPI0015BBBE83|nr:O-antigen ligase family protein [Pseudomonas taiwanensis]